MDSPVSEINILIFYNISITERQERYNVSCLTADTVEAFEQKIRKAE